MELVSAVSAAGGLGTLALTWTDADTALELVAAVRQRTKNPFVANFVLEFEPAALTSALEAGVPVVTFSWGMPGPLLALAHSFGAVVGVQIGTLDGAKCALDAGCDFVICQGMEAGGHLQSLTPLLSLLPEVIEAAGSVPIIAAGGLVDREDVVRVISLGARAAMLGTRFVASHESRAHESYKRSLLEAGIPDTVYTKCFDGGWPGAPHRVLRNKTFTDWDSAGRPPAGRRPGEGDIVARLESGAPIPRYHYSPPTCDMRGNALACCLYAGTGVGKIKTLQSAGELVRELSEG